MKLGVRKLHEKSEIPYFATDGAACFDLKSVSASPPHANTRVYDTGLAFDIPKGYRLDVFIRSGLSFNKDFMLANGVGKIDSDYTGSVKVKLVYVGPDQPNWPVVGDRIAQAELNKVTVTTFVEVDELKETERGNKGLGSTDE